MRFLMLLAFTTSALAHDMWIDPAKFTPKSGEIVSLRLFVGQDLIGDPLQRNPALIRQFIAEDAGGQKPVVGRVGGDPAGFVRVAAPGMMVIGYRSNPSTVDLPAEKFNSYLKEEGLDAIAALRSQRKETATPVRELFSRCAKSLLFSGPLSQAPPDRTLGFTLELTAERNPYRMHAGDSLPVRLTYENKPLPGALVIAMNREDPNVKVALRTGEDGRVRLPLARPGMWLIKAVHMIPAPTSSNANWESFWASLTFEIPSDTSPAPTN